MGHDEDVLIWESTRSKVFLHNHNGVQTVKKVYMFKEDLENEKRIYELLSEKNMLQMPEMISYGENYLILNYIQGRILREYINDSAYRDIHSFLCSNSGSAIKIKEQLICIVDNLHNLGVVHGNLKQSQFIVDNEENIFLIDYAGSCTSEAPYYFAYKKYDNSVIKSYFTGKKASRPSRISLKISKIKRWIFDLF